MDQCLIDFMGSTVVLGIFNQSESRNFKETITISVPLIKIYIFVISRGLIWSTSSGVKT